MLINLINLILFVLVIITYSLAQLILAITSIKDGYTFKEVINYSQNKKVGKIFMTIFYLPACFIMYLWSIRPINTKSCFDEMKDNELTSEQIREKYPMFFDVGEHYISYVRNGVVVETVNESHKDFENIIQMIENFNLKKIRIFSHTLHILPEQK